MDKEFLYMQKLAGEKLAHEYVAQYGKIKLNNE